MSYAKQLVEMHGGIIGAQNNETKGATFFFTLPYRQEAADIQSTPQTYLNDALHLSADIDYKQPQLPAYVIGAAMLDLSPICNLHHSSQQRQILNPLSEARD